MFRSMLVQERQSVSREDRARRGTHAPDGVRGEPGTSRAAAAAESAPGGLARITPSGLFAPVWLDLYRHVARLIELGSEHEFLVAPSGVGVTAQFLADLTGAAGAGVDPDAELTSAATARAREAGLLGRLQYEHARLDDLPFQDEVFDFVIGEPALTSTADPAAAVRELVRTAKPMAGVVLVQLIWTGNAGAERRETLVESLGVRPLMAVEWKQLLRDVGVVDLYIEDWSDSAVSPRQPWMLGPLAGFGSLADRVRLLLRAWRLWGPGGVRQALDYRSEVRDLVVHERILGLSVIKGTKWRSPGTPGD